MGVRMTSSLKKERYTSALLSLLDRVATLDNSKVIPDKLPSGSKLSGDQLESAVLCYLLASGLKAENSKHPTYTKLLTITPPPSFVKQLQILDTSLYSSFTVVSSSGANGINSANGNSDFILKGETGEVGLSCKRNNPSMKSARAKSLGAFMSEQHVFYSNYSKLVSDFNSRYEGKAYKNIAETSQFINGVRDLIVTTLQHSPVDFKELARYWIGRNSRRNLLVTVTGDTLILYECVEDMILEKPHVKATSDRHLQITFGSWGFDVRCHTGETKVGKSNPIKLEVTPLDKDTFYRRMM